MSSNEYIPIKKENQLIIAVCGPSTSGKSTLVYEIMEKYEDQIDCVAMEYFFDTTNGPHIDLYGKDYLNLDLKESIKWDDFYRSISENDSPILLIDGFILFADKRSFDIVDVCIAIEYNIETDFEIALDRRINRYPWRKKLEIDKNYLQDPNKNHVNQHCTYFHEVVWPEMVNHPEYRKPQNWEKPILTLSATDDLQKNIALSLDFLKPFIDSHLIK